MDFDLYKRAVNDISPNPELITETARLMKRKAGRLGLKENQPAKGGMKRLFNVKQFSLVAASFIVLVSAVFAYNFSSRFPNPDIGNKIPVQTEKNNTPEQYQMPEATPDSENPASGSKQSPVPGSSGKNHETPGKDQFPELPAGTYSEGTLLELTNSAEVIVMGTVVSIAGQPGDTAQATPGDAPAEIPYGDIKVEVSKVIKGTIDQQKLDENNLLRARVYALEKPNNEGKTFPDISENDTVVMFLVNDESGAGSESDISLYMPVGFNIGLFTVREGKALGWADWSVSFTNLINTINKIMNNEELKPTAAPATSPGPVEDTGSGTLTDPGQDSGEEPEPTPN